MTDHESIQQQIDRAFGQTALDVGFAAARASDTGTAWAIDVPAGMGNSPDPVSQEMFDRWRKYLQGEPRFCPHLATVPQIAGPEPIFWYPGGPGIMCPECMVAESQALAGTAWDFTCDRCGRVWEPGQAMHQDNITLKGSDLGDGKMSPPVVIAYAYCLIEPCREPANG